LVVQNGAVIHEASGAIADQTNNTMELQAAMEGLGWLVLQPGMRDRDIVLHSDSQYVCNGATAWRHAWKRRGWMRKDSKTNKLVPLANVRHWKLLDGLCNQFKSLRFEWVRGHVGNTHNERCDQLAGQAVWDFIERGGE
jgi:ribonuclease HI